MRNTFYSLLIAAFMLALPTLAQAEDVNPQVVIKTDMGDILVELYPKEAPVTVDNFVKLINDFHYDGLIFHRVIKGFMIQTGGLTFDLTPRESSRPAIVNESSNGLKNKRGTLSMARTADPDSAKGQFFINHKNNRSLDARDERAGYAVFGKVLEGMDVVDSIATVPTQSVSFYRDVPVQAIRILSARLLNPQAWKALPEPKAATLSFEKPTPIK